jgi:putative intracellular protease/amidase
MKKRILIVVTNHDKYDASARPTGLWLSEAVHFYDIFRKEGFQVDFISPKGGKSPVDPRSLSKIFLDGRTRSYYQDRAFTQLLENTKSPDKAKAADYDAIYYAGGHGALWDFPDDIRLQKLSRDIYSNGGVVSAVCHGVAGLLNIKLSTGSYLIQGRKVTGFSNLEDKVAGVAKYLPYYLEDELKKRAAQYQKAFIPFASHVVTDGMLVSGQNPSSAGAVAGQVLALIKKQYGRIR